MKSINYLNGAGTSEFMQSLQARDAVSPAIPLRADFLFAVSLGIVPGWGYEHKFGHGEDFDTANGVSLIWDGMSISSKIPSYTYSTTADINSIASSSAGDTVDISIKGLDTNWDLVEQTVTLTGQTAATLSTPLVRVFRAKNIGAADLVGDVYIATSSAVFSGGIPTIDTTIRAIIPIGYNQTQMAMYTVPAGHTLLIVEGWSGMSKSNTAEGDLTIWRRSDGGVFRILHNIGHNTVGVGSDHRPYSLPLPLPEKTDLEYRFEALADNSAASAGFHGLLVQTSLL